MLQWLTVVCSLLFYWMVSSTHVCPVSDQYPFSCSACLSFTEYNATWSAAGDRCGEQGGRLVTLREDVEWRMLLLYLESLNLSHSGVWVGYRLGEGGEVGGEEWESAPSAVVEAMQQSLSVRGSEAGDCVMVREGELVNTACSEERRSVCLFSYPAPRLSHVQPPLGAVYQVPAHSLTLEASITGLGITDVVWRHNGMLMTTPSTSTELRASQNHTRAELHITEYDNEVHRGSYELLVTSPAGRTLIATWSIRQAFLGNFTQKPQDLTILEGSIAFFECSVEHAMPEPTYTWYKEDDPVIPDGMSVYVSSVSHTLLMRDVGEEEEGRYHCHVENSAGSMDSPPATLTLRSQLQSNGSEFQFLLQPRDVTLVEGQPYSVECVGLHTRSGYMYIILFLRAVTSKVLTYPTLPGLPVNSLDSVSLEEHDGIESQCYCGPLGQDLSPSRTAQLTVHTYPRVESLLTSVGNGSGPHAIPPAIIEFGIECPFSGVPNPVQRWYRNGDVIPSDSELVVSSGGAGVGMALQEYLEPVSGVYQCHVTNQYGVAISNTVLCAQSLPGPTAFQVQADTTTSLYVTWTTPSPASSHHPLLLRYEVITTHTHTHHTISSGTLLPHQSQWVVTGLNTSSEYEVKVISMSPLGKGEEAQGQTMFTFGLAPQQSPLEFLNITVSRTHLNRDLVVQWYPTHPPSPGTVFIYYQVRHRRRGEGGGEVVQVSASQRWAFVEGLENAQDFEVQLRVVVQVQRSPPAYDHTPWTEWLAVQGVTTPPPITSSLPSATPSVEAAGTDERDDVLLVAVLVPVLSVVVLVVLLVLVTVGGWRLWAKRRAATYNLSKLERRLKGRRVPMGKEVFNLPGPAVCSTVIEETDLRESGGGYCSLSTLRPACSSIPSSPSENLTVDSPVHTESSNAE